MTKKPKSGHSIYLQVVGVLALPFSPPVLEPDFDLRKETKKIKLIKFGSIEPLLPYRGIYSNRGIYSPWKKIGGFNSTPPWILFME